MPRSVTTLVALWALCAIGCAVERAERLLRVGDAKGALAAVRPTDAASYKVRARALRSLGRLRAARTEARIGVVLAGDDAEAHRLLGFLEARLGDEGKAFEHLSRSLELDDGQPALRAIVERMRRRRAALAKRRAVGCAVPLTLPRRGRCALRAAGRRLERMRASELALGCSAARWALELESRRCLVAARDVWRTLRRGDADEARWNLGLARVEIALGRPKRAKQLLLSYAVASVGRRAAAQRDIAELWLAAGRKRRARIACVAALALAGDEAGQLAALALMRRADAESRRLREAAWLVVEGRYAGPGICQRAARAIGVKLPVCTR